MLIVLLLLAICVLMFLVGSEHHRSRRPSSSPVHHSSPACMLQSDFLKAHTQLIADTNHDFYELRTRLNGELQTQAVLNDDLNTRLDGLNRRLDEMKSMLDFVARIQPLPPAHRAIRRSK